MLRHRILLIALAAAGRAVAQSPSAADQSVEANPPMEEIVVNGEFPGPGMWKVTRPGDAGGHELWIVGDPPPLPKRMQWKSRDVEAVAMRAQEILLDAAVRMDPDEKIGLFRGLSLLPAALKARKNPDDTTLKDHLPPELYARWLVMKKRYIGSDSGIEKWRPIFAADKLRHEAFDELGLRDSGMVFEVVGKIAKQRKIATTSPYLRFAFHTDDLKSKLKEFSREPLADTECFSVTLDQIDAVADSVTQGRRAHAWATADLDTLNSLPPLPAPYVPCVMAVMGTQVAKEIVPADVREQLYALWIESAKKSLATNQTTLAIAPLSKLTREGGYLSLLRAQGLEIEAPK